MPTLNKVISSVVFKPAEHFQVSTESASLLAYLHRWVSEHRAKAYAGSPSQICNVSPEETKVNNTISLLSEVNAIILIYKHHL